MSENSQKAFEPASIGNLQLRNRIIKAATFEGKCPNGIPSSELINFHRHIGEGGVGMTTIGYCATEADGRISTDMMYMHEGIESELKSLISAVHATGAAVSGQMAHCGNFSKNRDLQRLKRPLGPSLKFNAMGLPAGIPIAGAMNARDIDTFVQTYSDAARFMKHVGFDALEIHFGHGYGLSQFISPVTNKRSDEYGGNLENRMRLPLRVLSAVQKAVGGELPIIGKISLMDGVKNGIQVEDAIEIAAMLDCDGIDGIVTSGGTSSYNVMKMFRGPSILNGMLEVEKNPLMKLGLKFLGPKMFREYPYEELYFLDEAKRVRDRIKSAKMIYIGGCSTPESLGKAMAEGMDFVQMGRTLIKDPHFVRNAEAAASASKSYDSGCTHCNRCVSSIEAAGGVNCPLNSTRTDAAILASTAG